MTVLRFGAFELDLRTGELRKAGSLMSLPPQPFRILALLASRPGELVTREEIQRHIWNGYTFVDFEQGLNFAVKKIRAALGDDAETPRYVETLPRRGYRFIAPVDVGAVHEPPPTDSLGNDVVKPALQRIQHEQTTRMAWLYFIPLATATITAILVWVLKPTPLPRPQPVF